jgi:para-aminobenzoate synthetase/4-amino-4-deoxychorismate lyase
VPAASKPNAEKGVFETLLVVAGRPIEVDAHLARLAGSVRALFGAELGGDALNLVIEEAGRLRLGRLRLTAAPQPGGGVALKVRSRDVDPSLVLPPAARVVALRSLVIPGGLGAHKWADRALLERAEAETPDASVPLLLDRDGSVLEASRANVFAVHDGVLTTPAVDGRILPGVTRALALEVARSAAAEVREARVARRRLVDADEVFLTGAVRGVEPVGSIDGIEVQPAGELTLLLAGELRRRWLGPG